MQKMGTRKEVSCLCLLVVLLFSKVRGDCSLQTPQGALTGSTMTSLHGRDFCSYRGIPYAQPPVGDLRFRNPEPALGWEGELNATKDGNSCVQGMLSVYYGSEDCLYLNVYTPQTGGESLPVLVFIHGGGYTSGSGNSFYYGPHYFLDKDVVMVTINYRLGVLGFLSTGDDASPGNYGLRDQLEALRWINKNIASFGGNPELVTIMGESAGGMSVHNHILSPLSKGLFHRAISNSGSTLMPIMFQPDPLPIAQKRAQEVGCPVDNNEDMVSCLRNLELGQLMQGNANGSSQASGLYSNIFSMFPQAFELPSNILSMYDRSWAPTVEVQSSGNPEPFLPGLPQDIIRSGNFNKVPYMLGTNSEESSMFLIFFIGTQVALDNLNANFDELAKAFLFMDVSVEESQIPQTVKSIMDFYLGNNHTITSSNVKQLIYAATDRFMQHNVHKTVQLHLANGHEDLYLYNMAYRGKYSLIAAARYDDATVDLGVLHADEMEYSLSSGLRTDKWNAGHPDLEVVDAVINLYTEFMRHGDPTLSSQPQGVTWPKAGASGEEVYYVFGHDEAATAIEGVKPLKITIEPDKFKDRMDFWDSLSLQENQFSTK